jgi:hypothetical protein
MRDRFRGRARLRPQRLHPRRLRRRLVGLHCAIDFAAEHGYDLDDYTHGGCVAGWWGFTWMILAEARGVLTPEKRAAAWCRHGEKTWWARKHAP